jgi:hypothetical protein
MQKVSELKEEPVIGKFYLVECALYLGEWIPIVGHQHSDPELDIHFQHYHKDVRFIYRKDFYQSRFSLENYGEGIELNRSLMPEHVRRIELKRRKCLRQMPEFVLPTSFNPLNTARWVKFQKAYRGRKVLCGKCPHRGMPLESLPKDESGHVVCNGHGLKIDMNRQVVVKR